MFVKKFNLGLKMTERADHCFAYLLSSLKFQLCDNVPMQD